MLAQRYSLTYFFLIHAILLINKEFVLRHFPQSYQILFVKTKK